MCFLRGQGVLISGGTVTVTSCNIFQNTALLHVSPPDLCIAPTHGKLL